MKSLTIEGTSKVVEFYEDDTIDKIRQLIAFHLDSHPNRLYIELKCKLPKDYYTSPKHWMNLFFRLSVDRKKIDAASMDVYLKDIRLLTGINAMEVTLEQWEERDERLKPLFAPTEAFSEYRIFGYQEIDSLCLSNPPTTPKFPSTPRKFYGQSLFETLYPFEEFEGFRVREVKPTEDDSKTQAMYYPFFTTETPEKFTDAEIETIQKTRTALGRLLGLTDVPPHKEPSITRAKWAVTLDATDFTSPRNRFEQMFYGLTVSKEIPYVGFFLSKNEQIRHKFYVTDSKAKKPELDVDIWKSWITLTQPQRRLPTLLLYKGTSRSSFDRITITPKNIVFSIHRDKKSEKTLDDLKESLYKWFQTFDSIVPFFEEQDVVLSNWKLIELSATAQYKDTIKEFNMNRFYCLQSIFLRSENKFRLLRVNRETDIVDPQLLQAYELLSTTASANPTEVLVSEMGVTQTEAERLVKEASERETDLGVQDYPVIEFNEKQVTIQFANNLERTLLYADILRYVLTGGEEVEAVCPSLKDVVREAVAAPAPAPAPAPAAISNAAPQQFVDEFEEYGFGGGARKVKVKQGSQTTHGYFLDRLSKFDNEMFDSKYSSSCEKNKQVVIVDETKGAEFDYSTEPEAKKLDLGKGTAICPLYWCMTDEVPLDEPNEAGTKEKNRLVRGEDGLLHCPICGGKVRSESDNQDRKEFSVIERNKTLQYPKFRDKLSKSGKQVPCCFKIAEKPKKTLVKEDSDETFILAKPTLPEYRMAMLPSTLAKTLHLKTNYENTVTTTSRFVSGVGDVFRVGIGRASKTLPGMLGLSQEIPSPAQKTDITKQCSFFSTWKYRKGEGVEEEQIIASIDDYFTRGQLTILQEVEYVAGILNCQVILLHPETYDVSCGFWGDYASSNTRSIAMIGDDILAHAIREKRREKLLKLQINANLNSSKLQPAYDVLKPLYAQACAVDIPTYAEVADKLGGKETKYDVILDPLGLVQAIYIQTTKVIIPVKPARLMTFPEFSSVFDGYHKFQNNEDLATVETAKNTLKTLNISGLMVERDLYNIKGEVVELLLKSGLRSLVRPQITGERRRAEEVLDTIRYVNEDKLLNAPENAADKEISDKISYESELYDFLLYSLSKDVQSNSELKQSIASKSDTLPAILKAWFAERGYEDATGDVVSFINKIRTPCGQFKKSECGKKSSLCGWKGSCKIKVQSSVVRAEALLNRMANELNSNSKKRLLVLDGYLEPFFSTILYLELPHELITTDIPSSS